MSHQSGESLALRSVLHNHAKGYALLCFHCSCIAVHAERKKKCNNGVGVHNFFCQASHHHDILGVGAPVVMLFYSMIMEDEAVQSADFFLTCDVIITSERACPPPLSVMKLFRCPDMMVKHDKNNDRRRLVEYFQLSTRVPVHGGEWPPYMHNLHLPW